MKRDNYHHGDLRRLLIETGIELISQEGEEALSLRKVAKECGVSNAAPYAHFKNKNDFIGAIQQHIMDLFTSSLEESIHKYNDSNEILPKMGKAYVIFFYENPLYYDFLFSRKNIKIQLSLNDTANNENLPFEILKKTAVRIFKKTNMPEKTIQNKIIAMWALVHGLSAILTMPNVEYDDRWEERIEEIIKSISIYHHNTGDE